MTTNIGSIDRIARLVLGAILLVAPFIAADALGAIPFAQIIGPVAGLVLIGTAAFKFCPIYRAFGLCSGGCV